METGTLAAWTHQNIQNPSKRYEEHPSPSLAPDPCGKCLGEHKDWSKTMPTTSPATGENWISAFGDVPGS